MLFYFKQLSHSKNDTVIFKYKEYLHPITLRNNSSDINVFYQVLFNQDYQLLLDDEPKIIIDLGANIGLSSIYFLNKYPDCKVIAVEPDIANFEFLKINTEKYPNILRYNNGIWNKNTWLKIIDNNLGSWGFSVVEVNNDTPNSIESITLDQIIQINNIQHIDILKIDIEGSEIELFQENFDKWMSITNIIIIELHDWMRDGCAKQFFMTLVKYNFKFSYKGENIICFLSH
jgi:FkbM family methyltransferase